VAPVEDYNFAFARDMPVHSPEKVMVAFFLRGRFKRDSSHSKWIDSAKDLSNGAVFSGSVHALEHD
jgi:hypothetical protein